MKHRFSSCASRPWQLLVFLVLLAPLAAGCDLIDPSADDDDEMPPDRGVLIETAPLGTLPAVLLEQVFQAEATYDVTLYQVVYQTEDVDGMPARASGIFAVPEERQDPLPLLSWQHATTFDLDSTASVDGLLSIDAQIAAFYATQGYFVTAPDYLGLGLFATDELPPFLNAQAEANAVVDLLRAARSFAEQKELPLNGRLFLTGYSEGGHATLAAHRALEARYADEFTVTASTPMAGPYDLEETGITFFSLTEPYAGSSLPPYVFLTQDAVFGLVDDLSDAVADPFAALLPELYDGTRAGETFEDQLPAIPAELFQPAYVEAFLKDPDHPFRQALQANEVFDWAPEAPVLLVHCADDHIVPFENSVIAQQAMQARGAAGVELIPLEGDDHFACAGPAIVTSRALLASFDATPDTATAAFQGAAAVREATSREPASMQVR